MVRDQLSDYNADLCHKATPFKILLAYDRWAARLILDACAKLSPEQFHQRFDLGPGSLHDTTVHMLGAMKTWTQTLAGQEPGARLEQGGPRSPADVIALLEVCARDFAAEAGRLPLSETVTRSRDGKSFTFTRGAVCMQVMTHGAHHRAQCLNMLKQLGVKPLPFSSVAEWTRFGEGSI